MRRGPVIVVSGVFALAVAVLSFADRAPAASKALLRPVRRLGSRIEMRVGIDLIDRSDVPLDYDTMGHIVIWLTAGLLGWWALGRRTTPLFLMLCLFVVSAGIEIGQGFLSATRNPSLSDLAANGLGVVLGVTIAVAAATTVDLFQRGVRSLAR